MVRRQDANAGGAHERHHVLGTRAEALLHVPQRVRAAPDQCCACRRARWRRWAAARQWRRARRAAGGRVKRSAALAPAAHCAASASSGTAAQRQRMRCLGLPGRVSQTHDEGQAATCAPAGYRLGAAGVQQSAPMSVASRLSRCSRSERNAAAGRPRGWKESKCSMSESSAASAPCSVDGRLVGDDCTRLRTDQQQLRQRPPHHVADSLQFGTLLAMRSAMEWRAARRCTLLSCSRQESICARRTRSRFCHSRRRATAAHGAPSGAERSCTARRASSMVLPVGGNSAPPGNSSGSVASRAALTGMVRARRRRLASAATMVSPGNGGSRKLVAASVSLASASARRGMAGATAVSACTTPAPLQCRRGTHVARQQPARPRRRHKRARRPDQPANEDARDAHRGADVRDRVFQPFREGVEVGAHI